MRRVARTLLDAAAVGVCLFMFLPASIYVEDRALILSAPPLLVYGLGVSAALLLILALRLLAMED